MKVKKEDRVLAGSICSEMKDKLDHAIGLAKQLEAVNGAKTIGRRTHKSLLLLIKIIDGGKNEANGNTQQQ